MPIDLTEGTLAELLAIKRLLQQHDVDIKRLWRRQPAELREVGNVLGEGSPVIESGSGSGSESGSASESSSASDSGSASESDSSATCCIWVWTGTGWVLANKCSCPSDVPAAPGSYVGQVQVDCCDSSSSASSSSSGSGGGECEDGDCTFRWSDVFGEWELWNNSCAEPFDCGCVNSVPSEPGSFEGEFVVVPCTPL